MVPDAEAPLDHGRDAPQRPALALEPSGQRAAAEHAQELAPLRGRERGRPSTRPAPQTAQPCARQTLLPVRHGRAADAHLPRDRGLGQPFGTEQAPSREAALFHLRTREPRWLPRHDATSSRADSSSC